MNAKRMFVALAGILVSLVLVLMVWSDPAPQAEAAPVGGRELDEAAEEVRAVATAIRRLEEKIADQSEWNQTLRADLAVMGQQLEQLQQRPEPSVEVERPEPEQQPAAAPEPELDLADLVNPDAPLAGIDALRGKRTIVWSDPVIDRSLSVAETVAEAATAPARFVVPPAFLAGRVLTALIGRVPQGGSVQDPWPFLAVSGADNWTANNTGLPHLRGILWRGVVSGDSTLQCVRASIRSLVYVFDDGVFYETHSTNTEGFGYLADRSGNPCLAGTVYTTAYENLGHNLLSSLVAGAGGAVAQEQLTTRSTGSGSEQSVTGDAFDLFLGQSVEGAARSYSDLLARNASDVWDAVVVPPGQHVDIHITAGIPIFYHANQRIHDETLVRAVPAAVGGLD